MNGLVGGIAAGDGPIRVTLLIGDFTAQRWHMALIERLEGPGKILVAVEFVVQPPGTVHTSPRLDAAFNHTQARLCRPLPATAFDRYRHPIGIGVDLTLDLHGAETTVAGRMWRLAFNGVPGQNGLHAALLVGTTPVATITEAGTVLTAGRLGTEFGGGDLRGRLEDMLARTITVIVAALADTAKTVPNLPGDDTVAIPSHSRPALALRGARRLAGSAIRELYRFCYKTPHWRVGWRRLGGDDVMALQRLPAGGWQSLPDDRGRFYADPFPIEHDGTVVLFVEEYPHDTRKGVVSAVTFGPDGPLGKPEPVLELPYHLSYPFVFAEDGEVWMIPESSAAATIDLFRSTRFPGGWVKEATLVSDTVASDATLIRHEGRWWLFATVRDGGGAYSDALYLWWADDFRGPWTAHRGNPVLIDIASARPAGRMVVQDGALWRPVQDCRRGYGAALGLARVSRLDEGGFEQTVQAILTPGTTWPGRRLHTLNRAGSFEFIDGSGSARRWF